MATYYSSPADVIAYTGVRPEDLGIEATEEDTADELLTALLTEWLEEAADLIDRDRRQSWLTELTIPAGINNIAKRLVANMVAQAVLRRDTPIIKIGDFAVKMTDDSILTRAIKRDLRMFSRPLGSSIRLYVPDLSDDL